MATTDGSYQGNHGPCGAGSVTYTENHQGKILKRPVASRGSILLAILMVLEHCIYTLREQFAESDEEEEMPFEAKMRMKNIGRETPTAAGPNSFGKGRLGFVDRNKAIERDIQKQLEDLGET
ncbi:Hypothetical predicted protein [Mytilus galloprovincialis]|uniref:PEST proteolytic signal-containing nuclear protein n=1 Tax=Mytilus galloprovincialis TaxID=29158 RepID=A0A8B6BGJ8_MYTGA|nr:Hypothetical predicted protein [Mytilus galloprovincialis]